MKEEMSLKEINKKGFTLIEVLVSVAIIGVLVTMAATIFINTVRSAKKADIINEARQNASLVLDSLQRDVRNASSATISADGFTLTLLGLGQITWVCVGENYPTANGFITRQLNGGSAMTVTNKDTSSGVSVKVCGFKPVGSTTDIVTLDFTMREGVAVQTAAQEYGVNLPFETSVTRRGF